MPIRPSHLLGFVLAIACAIGMNYFLSDEAMPHEYEVWRPSYWTELFFYFRVAFFLGPSVIMGLIFQRRAGFVAGGGAAVFYCYLMWLWRDSLYTREGEIALQVCRDFVLDGLLYIGLIAFLAALVAWLRFKWFPRSRFRAVKLWQIVVFFTLIGTGGRVSFEGAHGLYDEHQLNTIGKHAKVMGMSIFPGGDDMVFFKPDDVDKEFSVHNTAPSRLRERFNRGEEVAIRFVPGNTDVYLWEGEDRINRVLASWGCVLAGLVCLGLAILFGRWLRGWSRKSTMSNSSRRMPKV